jgi:hypothetical protein
LLAIRQARSAEQTKLQDDDDLQATLAAAEEQQSALREMR